MADDETSNSPSGLIGLLQRAEVLTDIHVVRGALVVLATIASIAFMYYASAVLVPIVTAIFLAYVLNPAVLFLSRLSFPGTAIHMPRWMATLLVVLASVALATVLGVFIVDEVRGLANDMPRYQNRIAGNIADIREAILQFQDRMEGYLEPIRREDGAEPGPAAQPVSEGTDSDARVSMEETADLWSSISSYVFGSITSLLAFTGQALMCLFVLFFILLEGPVLKTKAINIMGTSLRRRRVVLEILHNVNEDVQRYLFNRVLTNTVLAIIVGFIFYAYGMRYAFLIGVLAGIFNFVPYVGPIIGSVVPALIAYFQFGDVESVFWAVFIYGLATGLEGNIFTPIVLGRHLKLNSLAVLIACIFWGWLWGPIGLLLAVPIIAVFKAVAEHVDGMRPIGELLRG